MPKSREDHADRLLGVKERMAEIDTEFRGAALTPEARDEWNALGKERDELVKLIEELDTREAVVRSLADDADKTEQVADRTFNTNVRKSDADIYDMAAIRHESRDENHMHEMLRENAMRSVDAMVPANDAANREDAQARVQKILSDDSSGSMARRILTTGSASYKRAFGKAVESIVNGSPVGANMSNEERTALSTSTSSNAGLAVPYVLDPTVILTNSGVVNPWREICRNVTIPGETWKPLTSAGITAAYITEGNEASDNSPTFTQPSATVTRASAFVPFSMEIDQDWGGLQAELSVMFSDAKQTLEAQVFATGTGTTPQPLGILGIGFTGGITTVQKVASVTTAVFAVADVYALEQALSPRFRPNASIVANRAVYNAIRQFDTAGGASLFVNNLQLGIVNKQSGVLSQSLLGYNTYESSVMSSTPATSAQQTMLIGDFSNFVIVDRIGMNVELAPMLFGSGSRYPTGQRGLLAYWRNTSVLLNGAAFNYLQIK